MRARMARVLDFSSSFLIVVVLGLAGLTLPAAKARAETAGDAPPGALVFRGTTDEDCFGAPLVSTDVSFRVSGMVARARIVQTFHNPRDGWYEGVYVFPLPEKAAVDRLRLRIGERVIEGEIRERVEARQAYDQARAAGQRTALMDEERPNIFTTRVANVGPRQTVVVELEYQQTLRYADGRFSLRFPMVVGPRYIPGNVQVAGAAGEGWARDTDRVPDAARITPPVLRPERGLINPVALRVELDAGVPLAALSSPYHRVNVQSLGGARHAITLADGATPANRDFELVWTPEVASAPQAAWFVERQDAGSFGLLMLLPPGTPQAARLPRETIFVLDTSGSMSGASIRQAKEALELALTRLAPQDRFNVIEFNSTARRLFDEARDATPANLQRAAHWIRRLDARGGTEMAAALHLALDGRDATERVRQVIFLTDGAVGNEEELFTLIRGRLGGSRLFTVGIGSAPNSHFMTKAAQLGRGTFTYIGRIEEVREKMGELFAKLESPGLKQVELHWPEGVHAEAWPKRVPDLYAGEPVVVVAALDRPQGELRVTGMRAGELWETRVPLARASAASGMSALWAREKVAALMDSVREGAPEAEIRLQVIELATAHRLVTKYTSFVAVDRTPVRPAGADLKVAAVPTNLPEGWEYDKVFGELPRGATDSRFALLTGLVAMLLGALLLAVRRRRVIA